jgi:hypothetical protein
LKREKPLGFCYPLNVAIAWVKKDVTHTMTTQDLLESWGRQGFNFVYVSFSHYKCSGCKKTMKIEFYTNPIFIDPQQFDKAIPVKEKVSA